jgi:hypothetical protein
MITKQDKAAKSEYYALLRSYQLKKYPNAPDTLLNYPKAVNLTKTNDIEKCIVKWFEMNGYIAERTKTQGRRLGNDVAHHDFLGKVQFVEKAKFIPSTARNGSCYIKATCRDKAGLPMSLAIEVKNVYTNDRIRPDQIKYKEQFEKSGGVYVVIRCFSEFVEWYKLNVL